MYLNLENQQSYAPTNTSWYQGPTSTRGGATSQYTIKNYFPNECQSYAQGLVEREIDYFLPQITVVTDGTCGSACALFIAQLQSYRSLSPSQSVKIVSYCGYGNSVPDTASFAGGNVLDTTALGELFSQTNFNDTRLPIQFPTSAIARFNFHEYYINAAAPTPREFMKLPADVHLGGYGCGALFADDLTTVLGNNEAWKLYQYAFAAQPPQA